MTELLHQLSDNQLALLGCLGAFGGSLLLLAISFHTNPANRPAVNETARHERPASGQPGDTQRKAA